MKIEIRELPHPSDPEQTVLYFYVRDLDKGVCVALPATVKDETDFRTIVIDAANRLAYAAEHKT